MTQNKGQTIEYKANTKKEFFLIHGYTGSTKDFNYLPKFLHKKFNANVKLLCLKGHETKIEDLDQITYKDFIEQIEPEIKKDLAEGKEIIIGGVSLGALLALYFATKYSFKGILNYSPPYYLKLPFSLPKISLLGKYKKYWFKYRYPEEKNERIDDLSYDYMHGNGLSIVLKLNTLIKKNLINIKCPILSIHSKTDPIGHYKSIYKIHKKIKSTIKIKKVFNTKIHNVFFSIDRNEIYHDTYNFVENNNLFEENKPDKIACIIPAYNEGKRIGEVLKVVIQSKLLNEIIVIDDGSQDNTEDVVRNFPQVRYLKNNINIGKASSMERGVNETDADIIFFCDADLTNFKPEYIDGIIKPVIAREYNMFIGIRGNLMQKTVHLFAINSGERAIRRVVWEKLPYYFKYKYRVEAGLNYYVKNYFGGFGFKKFNYSQPIKEKKYGFIKGTILRWGMNIDVLSAYGRDIFGRLFKRSED